MGIPACRPLNHVTHSKANRYQKALELLGDRVPVPYKALNHEANDLKTSRLNVRTPFVDTVDCVGN